TRFSRDWSSDVCSSDLLGEAAGHHRARCAEAGQAPVADRPAQLGRDARQPLELAVDALHVALLEEVRGEPGAGVEAPAEAVLDRDRKSVAQGRRVKVAA